MPELKLEEMQKQSHLSEGQDGSDKENLVASPQSFGKGSNATLVDKLSSMSGVKLLNYIQSP
jgi:hypothetical protein